jgi:hypothetical protein
MENQNVFYLVDTKVLILFRQNFNLVISTNLPVISSIWKDIYKPEAKRRLWCAILCILCDSFLHVATPVILQPDLGYLILPFILFPATVRTGRHKDMPRRESAFPQASISWLSLQKQSRCLNLARLFYPVIKGPVDFLEFLQSANRCEQFKSWGFHGGDYEECRLLGNKNPVHTSQETHYISATEPLQLMLCKIWGFHGAIREEYRLLGCIAVWLL